MWVNRPPFDVKREKLEISVKIRSKFYVDFFVKKYSFNMFMLFMIES